VHVFPLHDNPGADSVPDPVNVIANPLIKEKLILTDLFPIMVTVQEFPLTESHPARAERVEPASGVAVIFTTVLEG
jgi:hypothetical protein